MAADYEHGRNHLHLVVMLLIAFWCGITYTGLCVTDRPYSRAFAHDVGCTMTFTEGQQFAYKNWFQQNRQQLQCQSQSKNSIQNCIQNSFTNASKKITMPFAGICLQEMCSFNTNCTARQYWSADDLCHDDDMRDDPKQHPYSPINYHIQGPCERASIWMHLLLGLWGCGYSEKGIIGLLLMPKVNHPIRTHSLWALIALFAIISELAHAFIAHACTRHRQVRDLWKRDLQRCPRVCKCTSVIRAGFVRFGFRILWTSLFCLGCLSGASEGFYWGCLTPPKVQFPNKPKKQKSKPHDFMQKLGIEFTAFVPQSNMFVECQQVLGDGNCMWRAASRFTTQKWYILKKNTLQHLKSEA